MKFLRHYNSMHSYIRFHFRVHCWRWVPLLNVQKRILCVMKIKSFMAVPCSIVWLCLLLLRAAMQTTVGQYAQWSRVCKKKGVKNHLASKQLELIRNRTAIRMASYYERIYYSSKCKAAEIRVCKFTHPSDIYGSSKIQFITHSVNSFGCVSRSHTHELTECT